ncbi:GPN-loop GTPase 2 [Salpingoeca rosetta]|uniref:GPN-loop GTPase 2 n=1 Tax=Salpingoeca rosetta (strain ATCC 50818 / BSB-021) TaxID=946362 RepID=F2U970_SALR5|nr:GPN-loop GTPase 2 [Salpingoeca rosetta]EGD73273.1 GPN-loop GTPase 2 [Salpingoeca rosetta]|eukprot:XP_004994304.1 GPN-loop GTPase 2 [Salpingoeca rosetta]
MTFGQVVIGPPGSGKTTYALAVGEFMRARLGRKVCVVNLDPACEGYWPPAHHHDDNDDDVVDDDDEEDSDEEDVAEGVVRTKSEAGNNTHSSSSGSSRRDKAQQGARKKQTTSINDNSTKDESATRLQGASSGDGRTFDIDVRDLVRADEVMERLQLGPNAALVFCMEFLEQNLSWLKERIDEHKGHTFVFDCPGQVELYTHHRMMRGIVQTMQDTWHMRVCCVHLVDSFMCSDPANFMSALLVSMSAMMMLELPHVNVLSKVDLIEAYGRLHFNLDFYTEVLDLHYLVDQMEAGMVGGGRRQQRFHALTVALADLVQDYALVHFQTLNVQSPESMGALVRAVDKAVGNLYTQASEGQVAMESAVFSQPPLHESHAFAAQREYMS